MSFGVGFPGRKKNRENYTTLDEMMDLIGRKLHGSWLVPQKVSKIPKRKF
jgi:hypothetical protein